MGGCEIYAPGLRFREGEGCGIGASPVGLCKLFDISTRLSHPLFHWTLPSFPSTAMSAPTNVAAPPLPVGEKPIAMPKKQPYPFWLGGN